MAWLWGKIKLRGTSSTLKGEKLGYLEGSFDVLTQNLQKYLENKDCKILLNTAVNKVVKKNEEVAPNNQENTNNNNNYIY